MNLSPSLAIVREVFESELRDLGGRVSDCFEDGERLFLRGVLPRSAEILKGDRVDGGVALRVVGRAVMIHPYTFRQVCSNGAIMVHATGTQVVERLVEGEMEFKIEQVCEDLREAVRACAEPAAFERAAGQMRDAANVEANWIISLMPMLAKMPAGVAATWLERIVEQFSRAGDRSGYGLMNAVTATARESRDPETRWDMEELGGALVARLEPSGPKVRGAAVEMVCA